MKYFATLLAVVPAVLALPDNFAELAKRTTCAQSDFSAGIVRIQNSVKVLSSSIGVYGTASPPCTSVNLSAVLGAANNLIKEINADASTIGACSVSITTCSDVQKQVTATLIPRVSALSVALVARKKIVCCNNLGGVVAVEASSISSAVARYGASIGAKLGGTCKAAASNDVVTIQSYVNGIIKTVTC